MKTHWFPLTRLAIKPLFPEGGCVRGGLGWLAMIKWRNPHQCKLYGYGLCEGSNPPPKQPAIRYSASIFGTWVFWWFHLSQEMQDGKHAEGQLDLVGAECKVDTTDPSRFNSTNRPWKWDKTRAPKGKDRLPLAAFFSGYMCIFSETNSSPLKMNGWKMKFLLGWPMFRGYVYFQGL